MDRFAALRRIFHNPFKRFDEPVPVPASLGPVQLLRLYCSSSDNLSPDPYSTVSGKDSYFWPDETKDGIFADDGVAYNTCAYMQVDIPCVVADNNLPKYDAACTVMPFFSDTTAKNAFNPTWIFPHYMPTKNVDYNYPNNLRRWFDISGPGQYRCWILCQAVKVMEAYWLKRPSANAPGLLFNYWDSRLAMFDTLYDMNTNFRNEMHIGGSTPRKGPGRLHVLNSEHPIYVFRRPYYTEDHEGLDLYRRQCFPYDATLNSTGHTAPRMSFCFHYDNLDLKLGNEADTSFKIEIVSWLLVSSRHSRFPAATCTPITDMSWTDVHKLSVSCPLYWDYNGL